MYNTGEMKAAKAEVDRSDIMANRIQDKFIYQNDMQLQYISTLEEKLNMLLDRRTPKQDAVNDNPPPIINDFNAKLCDQLAIMEKNTNTLERLAKHISEIV